MKKLLILAAVIIPFNFYCFNLAEANSKNIEFFKEHLALMYHHEHKEIKKNTLITATANIGSKAALIASIILLTSNHSKPALACACVSGLLETVSFCHASKISSSGTKNSILELLYTLLSAQNALPNDKNQQ